MNGNEVTSPSPIQNAVVDVHPVLNLNGRGINLVVFHPTTGQVIFAQAYDNWAHGNRACAQLVEDLSAFDDGSVVSMAFKDEGSNTTPELQAMIASCGGIATARKQSRSSWAMIGVKGRMSPGEANEQYNANGDPVTAKYCSYARVSMPCQKS